jgi:hypothetical protein
LGKGYLYKSTATTWSKSTCKYSNKAGTTMLDGTVQHSDGASWHSNYPMEQLYEQYFNVVWTQAYNGSGVKLDAGTWGDHPRCGDTANFRGLWGFDNAAMKSFVSGGIVQGIQIEVMFDDPSHTGNPDTIFGVHIYKSKPTSATMDNINTLYTTASKFTQTGSDFRRWITLPTNAWIGGDMGGVAVWAAAATAVNSARFAGDTTSHNLDAFNTRLWIQVMK